MAATVKPLDNIANTHHATNPLNDHVAPCLHVLTAVIIADMIASKPAGHTKTDKYNAVLLGQAQANPARIALNNTALTATPIIEVVIKASSSNMRVLPSC